MKKIIYSLSALLICFHSYAQLVVPQLNSAAGPMSSVGSWLNFSTGGNNTSIQENWGLNLSGDNNRPIRVYNSSLLVGYQGYSQDFGINNALIAGKVGIGTMNPAALLDLGNGGNVKQLIYGSGGDTGYYMGFGVNLGKLQIR